MADEKRENAPDGDAGWERWQKKRAFVRALEGTYGALVRELLEEPRAYPSSTWKWKGKTLKRWSHLIS